MASKVDSNHRDRIKAPKPSFDLYDLHSLSAAVDKGKGSPGLVVMRRDSCSEGRGFESRHRILDGHFSHLYVVKIVMMFI